MIMVDIWGLKVNGYGYDDLRWYWFEKVRLKLDFEAVVNEFNGMIQFRSFVSEFRLYLLMSLMLCHSFCCLELKKLKFVAKIHSKMR